MSRSGRAFLHATTAPARPTERERLALERIASGEWVRGGVRVETAPLPDRLVVRSGSDVAPAYGGNSWSSSPAGRLRSASMPPREARGASRTASSRRWRSCPKRYARGARGRASGCARSSPWTACRTPGDGPEHDGGRVFVRGPGLHLGRDRGRPLRGDPGGGRTVRGHRLQHDRPPRGGLLRAAAHGRRHERPRVGAHARRSRRRCRGSSPSAGTASWPEAARLSSSRTPARPSAPSRRPRCGRPSPWPR